jgi:hypothetical protein
MIYAESSIVPMCLNPALPEIQRYLRLVGM